MSYWKGVQFLITQDVKNARWKNLTVFVFIAYIAVLTLYSFVKLLAGKDTTEIFFIEYGMILIFSAAGLMATHLYSFGGNKHDPLAERLRYWRTLPIKLDQIVWSRILAVSMYTIAGILFYYILVFVASIFMNEELSVISLLLHALQLMAFSLLTNYYFLFCEMIYTYKKYNIICWIFPFLTIGIILLTNVLGKFSFMKFFNNNAIHYPIVTAIVSMGIIIGSLLAAHALITPQFRKRNL